MSETAVTQRNGTHCLSPLLIKMEGKKGEMILVTFYINSNQLAATTHCSWQLTYGRKKNWKGTSVSFIYHLMAVSSPNLFPFSEELLHNHQTKTWKFQPAPKSFYPRLIKVSGGNQKAKTDSLLMETMRMRNCIRKATETNKKLELCGRLRTKVLKNRTYWVMAPLGRIPRVHKSRKHFLPVLNW